MSKDTKVLLHNNYLNLLTQEFYLFNKVARRTVLSVKYSLSSACILQGGGVLMCITQDLGQLEILMGSLYPPLWIFMCSVIDILVFRFFAQVFMSPESTKATINQQLHKLRGERTLSRVCYRHMTEIHKSRSRHAQSLGGSIMNVINECLYHFLVYCIMLYIQMDCQPGHQGHLCWHNSHDSLVFLTTTCHTNGER